MARGMSTRALNVRRPGNRYRVRMNAMAVPITPLTAVVARATATVSQSALRASGSFSRSQKTPIPSRTAYWLSDTRGRRIRTKKSPITEVKRDHRTRGSRFRDRAAISRLFLLGPLPHRIDDVFPRVLPSAQVVDGERFGHQGVLGPELLLDVPVHGTKAVLRVCPLRLRHIEKPDQLVDGVLQFRTDVPVDPGDLPLCLDRLPGHAYGIVAALSLLQQRLVLVGHDGVPEPANDAETSTSFPNFSRYYFLNAGRTSLTVASSVTQQALIAILTVSA